MTAPADDLLAQAGRSVWFDLPTTNLADTMSFYTGLLNWDYAQMEDSSLSDYVMIQAQGKLIGGLRQISKADKPSSGSTTSGAILYFTVGKLAPSVARARELGAEIVGETVDLGIARGRYQWIRDREGNLVGLWASE